MKFVILVVSLSLAGCLTQLTGDCESISYERVGNQIEFKCNAK